MADEDTTEAIARAIYIEMVLDGDERGNRDHLAAVFGPYRKDSYQGYGVAARRAAIAARALIDPAGRGG